MAMNKITSNDQDVLKAIYRTKLDAFYQRAVEELFPGRVYHPAPYIQAIIHQMMLIVSGDVTRLIINIPPRYFKSTIVSVVFTAFVLGLDPTRKIIVVSYANELAVELHNLTRDLMQSDFYRSVFPGTKIKAGKNTEIEFKTTMNGGRRAVSTGGSITGFGGDLIICDDLMKPEDANSDVKREKANSYLQTTLLSRLEDKKDGAMIVVQQRLHVDDTTGHLIEKGGWDHLSLPAIAVKKESIPLGNGTYLVRAPGEALDPAREDLATLEKLKSDVGSHVFSAQWQQLPTLPGGNLLKLEQFRRYEVLPLRHFFEYYVQSWDLAVTASDTSDYSVCTTWGKRGDYYYLIDVFRAKLDYPDLRKAVEEQFQKHEPRLVLFEGCHIGKALLKEFYGSKHCAIVHGGPIIFKTATPRGTKEERAAVQAVKIEQGRVFIPAEAEWLEIFEKEVLEFPAGKYDDQVDSMAHFLWAIELKIPKVNW